MFFSPSCVSSHTRLVAALFPLARVKTLLKPPFVPLSMPVVLRLYHVQLVDQVLIADDFKLKHMVIAQVKR